MKKSVIIIAASALLISSCGTYTGSGAYAGSTLGSILGSAIGGISGGPRGSDIGTIVGMVGGAVVGGAIGAAADERERQDVHDHYQRVMDQKAQQNARQGNYGGYQNRYQDDMSSGFDATNSGDDRIDLDLSDTRTAKPASVKPVKVKKSSAKQKAKPAKVKEPVDDMYVL